MALTVIGTARDLRTDTPVVYAQIPVLGYLDLVGEEFEDFSIQRRRENHKAYQRLKSDIKAGALLPSITLAVKPDRVEHILPIVHDCMVVENRYPDLVRALSISGQVDILDGLQRTYIISDLHKEGFRFVEGQEILLEFWLEANLNNLIYRIIVLNAGQKPMSMRHQIELLFMSLKTSVENNIPGLELYTERDNSRRRKAKKFAFNVVVSSYQAFITGSPELHKENIIANQLIQETALDSSEEEISKQFSEFSIYLRYYADLDEHVFRLYRSLHNEDDASETTESEEYLNLVNPNWLATDNVMMAFFAAIKQFGTSDVKTNRILRALDNLRDRLAKAEAGGDPLSLATFDKLRAGNNPRRINVGLATRRLLTNGFKEFFRESGDIDLQVCWQLGAE